MSESQRFEWERAIRVLPLRPPMLHCVALHLATYANADGTNAHPGETRIAAEIGISARAVRDYLQSLRNAGLIERTFEGSSAGRRKLADCYALKVPPDARQRVLDEVARRDARAVAKKEREKERRTLASGDPEVSERDISGGWLPDHRKPRPDDRKPASKDPGSQPPPTTTSTKDVDQASPTSNHSPAPATVRARAREQIREIAAAAQQRRSS